MRTSGRRWWQPGAAWSASLAFVATVLAVPHRHEPPPQRHPGRQAPTGPVPPFEPPEPSRRADVTWLQPHPDAWLDRAPDPEPGPAELNQARIVATAGPYLRKAGPYPSKVGEG